MILFSPRSKALATYDENTYRFSLVVLNLLP